MATITLDALNPTLVHPATGKTALIGNRDTQNTIIWATDQGSVYVDAFGQISPDANILDPLEYLTVDGGNEFWAMCQPGNVTSGVTTSGQGGLPTTQLDFSTTAQIIVTEGVTSWVPSAALIADAIAESGLALALAAAIAGSGFSFLAAPVLLYGGQVQPPTGTPGLVGVTLIQYQGMKIGGFPTPNLAAVQAIEAQWDTDQGTPGMGNNVSKRYFHTSEYPSAGPNNDSQNCANIAASGAKLLVSLKPAIDPTGNYTSATFTSEFNKLVAAIAYIVSVATNGVEFTLWQEFNYNMQQNFGGTSGAQAAANYSKWVMFYGPAFKTPNQATNQLLCVDFSTATNNINTAWNGGSYASQIDFAVVDAYASDWTKVSGGQNFVDALNAAEAIADGLGAGSKFGFWEWGVSNGPTVNITSSNHVDFVTWNDTYIIGTMTSRLIAGKKNADVVWYVQGTNQNFPQSDATGVVASEIQKTFQTLTSKPTTAVTISPGNQITLVPNKPSPIAGYAIANGLSYDITINLATTAGSTIPFAKVQLNWFNIDSLNAQPVSTQNWTPPMGVAGSTGTITVGKGPQRGQFLQVNVQNRDSVPATVNLQLNSTSRTVVRDDWRWDAPGSVNVPTPAVVPGGTTFTVVGGGHYGNELGVVSGDTLAAGASKAYLFSMFSGEAFVRFSAASESGVGVLQYVAVVQPQLFWGSAALINQTPTAEFSELIILPRGPLIITVTNTGTAPHNTNIVVTLLDGGG